MSFLHGIMRCHAKRVWAAERRLSDEGGEEGGRGGGGGDAGWRTPHGKRKNKRVPAAVDVD